MRSKPIKQTAKKSLLFCSILVMGGLSVEPLIAGLESDTTETRGVTVEDLVAIRDIQTMVPSPDGKYIAFQTLQRHISSNDFSVEWHIGAAKPGVRPQRVASGKESARDQFGGYLLSSDIAWSPDSKWIYFTKVENESEQIWRSSLESAAAQQLTHNAGDVQSFEVSRDGAAVFFKIGRTRAAIAAMKAAGARQGYLEQNPPLYYVMHGPMIPFCTDGRERFQRGPDDLTCRLTTWVYDLEEGVERMATEPELAAMPAVDDTIKQMSRQGFLLQQTERKMQKPSPGGGMLAWIENADPEAYPGVFPPMVLSASVDDVDIRCPAPECIDQNLVGFGGLWWREDGKEIIFKVNDGPHNSLMSFYGWVPGDNTVRTILRTDDRFTDCEMSGDRLICSWETWTSPARIAALDPDNGGIEIIIDLNPEFHDIRFTRVEKILGEDDHGHRVYAHLVYPEGYEEGQKYPLIVTQYHSYGFLRGATGHEQPIHVYARNGIAVLSVDHRQNQHDSQQSIVYPASNTAYFRNLYIDQGPATVIENMVTALVDRGLADPARIGITGFSMGDQVLSTVLMRRNYAAASSAGVPSIPTYTQLPSTSTSGKALNEIFGEPFSERGQEMRLKYSLMANANKIDTPILMQVPDREYDFYIHNYYALLDAGKPVEMYVYPDEYHVKWQPAHNFWVYSRNLDWFNFWLRGVEDPDPAKTTQYKRWRGLREKYKANMAEAEM